MSLQGINISTLPACAQTCLAGNSNAASGCALTDPGCFCKSTRYINAISCCLEKGCGASDQQTAIAFNIALCQSYNVSIPDFLGCSPLTGSSSSQTTLASLPSSIFVPTVATQQTVTGYIPAYTTPSGGNVATFTGDALLTGSCMTPVIATYTMNNGGLMEYPWVGCSDKNTACCPFAANSPGLLTICPHDYITAAGACCPSGWAPFTSALAGQTPCYTSVGVPIVAQSSASVSSGSSSPSIITDRLFTLQYQLATEQSSSLGGGAIAGIAIGSIAGVLLLGVLALLLFRHRQRRAQEIRNSTLPRAQTGELPQEFSPTKAEARRSHSRNMSEHTTAARSDYARTEYRSELPSPPPRSPPLQSGFYPPQSPVGSTLGRSSPVQVQSPQELPGSTTLHEHHPALVNAASATSPQYVPLPARSPRGLVSGSQTDLAGHAKGAGLAE